MEHRDAHIIEIFISRDDKQTSVKLEKGRTCEVWKIGWGYDEGDYYAHIICISLDLI